MQISLRSEQANHAYHSLRLVPGSRGGRSPEGLGGISNTLELRYQLQSILEGPLLVDGNGELVSKLLIASQLAKAF